MLSMKKRANFVFVKYYSYMLLNALVFHTLCCTIACQAFQENSSLPFIQEFYKNKYGFKDPSLETKEVFNDVTNRLHVQATLLEYPSNEPENYTRTFGPPLSRFIVMPNLSTLEEHHKAYEIFNLYRELNKIISWNGFSIVGGIIGFAWAIISLYPLLNRLYPFLSYDISYTPRLIQQGIISPTQALKRIISPLLFTGLYTATGIALGSAVFQGLFKSILESGLDMMSCQQLTAHSKIDILEKTIEYLKNHAPREEERVEKLQLCKKYPMLPAWKRFQMKETL